MADPTTTEHPLTREYLDAKLNELRMELLLEVEKLRGELRAEMQRLHNETLRWMITVQLTCFFGTLAAVWFMLAHYKP